MRDLGEEHALEESVPIDHPSDFSEGTNSGPKSPFVMPLPAYGRFAVRKHHRLSLMMFEQAPRTGRTPSYRSPARRQRHQSRQRHDDDYGRANGLRSPGRGARWNRCDPFPEQDRRAGSNPSGSFAGNEVAALETTATYSAPLKVDVVGVPSTTFSPYTYIAKRDADVTEQWSLKANWDDGDVRPLIGGASVQLVQRSMEEDGRTPAPGRRSLSPRPERNVPLRDLATSRW